MSLETPPLQRVSILPGPSVLSVLRHLNYKPWFALAEFVDNSVQSYLENAEALHALHGNEWKLRVFIDLDGSPPGRIRIRDNAAGISRASFPRAFRPAVVPPDTQGLSEFGMGMKSAACWFASKWQVRTKALGETVERRVSFDIATIVRDEIEELEIQEIRSQYKSHFTEIILQDVFQFPYGRTLGKIKEHLTDIYRVFIREGILEFVFNTSPISYQEPSILFAPFYKAPDGPPVTWKRDIKFEFGGGLSVSGFAALRDPGNYSQSGFALFRRKRLIEGSGEDGYRPPILFGTSGSSSYARLRLFGELHLEGFEVSHTKDGFRWDENEEPFLELLKEELDQDDLPLLRQCENYRSLASKKDRGEAANRALKNAGDQIEEALPEIIPIVDSLGPAETRTERLTEQPFLARREFKFDFRGQPWLINIELSDDPSELDWLSISDIAADLTRPETVEIRMSMAHPFMVSFAQTDEKTIEPLLRVAAALGISEKLARRAGVRSAGTLRRNLNEILREALSEP